MFRLNTVSVHLKGEATSNLDLDGYTLPPSDLKRVEDFANQVIWENRLVRIRFVAPDELVKLPVRGQATVEKDIRLVEIESLDFTPCGGTHVSQTGALGSIKILKYERQGQGSRIWFVAGEAALRAFQSYQDVVVELGKQLNVSIQDLPAAAGRQAELLKAAQQELQTLKRERLIRESEDMASQAEAHGKIRYVQTFYQDRAVEDLRFLGEQLSRMSGMAAVLATSSGGRYSLVFACAADTGLNASALISTVLSRSGGRGGGSKQLAQGGGAGGQEQAQEVIEAIQLTILGRE
jgi:alanyl-tRNA synthetase